MDRLLATHLHGFILQFIVVNVHSALELLIVAVSPTDLEVVSIEEDVLESVLAAALVAVAAPVVAAALAVLFLLILRDGVGAVFAAVTALPCPVSGLRIHSWGLAAHVKRVVDLALLAVVAVGEVGALLERARAPVVARVLHDIPEDALPRCQFRQTESLCISLVPEL
jgi:hypothetical protein